MTLVTAGSRLHLGLLDVGGATPRAYGGLGVGLAGPSVEVHVSYAPAEPTDILTRVPLDPRDGADAKSLLMRMSSQFGLPPLLVHIQTLPPQHVGFGSKTALLLAIASAVSAHCSLDLPPDALRRMTDRGGASGVGVHAYFRGGLIVDCGHPAHTDLSYQPSSASAPERAPTVSIEAEVCPAWRFALVLPSGHRRFGATESQFFAENTPIPKSEVLAALALAYHGIVPAFLEHDLASLRSALCDFSRVGFKRIEIAAQPPGVQEAHHSLLAIPGVAAGMSSMGPLLYAVHDAQDQEALAQVVRLCHRRDYAFIGSVPARTTGPKVE